MRWIQRYIQQRAKRANYAKTQKTDTKYYGGPEANLYYEYQESRNRLTSDASPYVSRISFKSPSKISQTSPFKLTCLSPKKQKVYQFIK